MNCDSGRVEKYRETPQQLQGSSKNRESCLRGEACWLFDQRSGFIVIAALVRLVHLYLGHVLGPGVALTRLGLRGTKRGQAFKTTQRQTNGRWIREERWRNLQQSPVSVSSQPCRSLGTRRLAASPPGRRYKTDTVTGAQASG